MTQKLTKKLIDSFQYIDGKTKDIRWDSDIRGFGIRIYASGKKSFVISYRQNGVKKLMVLGQYGNITLDQARNIAKKRFGEIADQIDPLAVKKAIQKKHTWTVQKSFSDYLVKYAKIRTKNWKETERIFNFDVLPKHGARPLDEISRQDVIKILDKIMARGSHIMANRTLAHMRKFFGWCVERGIIEHAPTNNIKMPAKSASRDVVLSEHEIKDIWIAADKAGYPFGCIIQILLLTAQRRSEVASMKWDDIDFEKEIWRLPKENTKANRLHVIPLSSSAMEIIRSAPKLGEYVFSSSGKKPFENFTRHKVLLDQYINTSRASQGIKPMLAWRIHDLRRTATSEMASLGVEPHVAEAILNHSSGIISGVAKVYNRYDYMRQKRSALKLWELRIIKLKS